MATEAKIPAKHSVVGSKVPAKVVGIPDVKLKPGIGEEDVMEPRERSMMPASPPGPARPRISSSKKGCVRSKLGRCLTHLCQMQEEKKKVRTLHKDEEGKLTQGVEERIVFVCNKNSINSSLMGSVSGGKRKGKRLGDFGGVEHVERKP